MPKTSAGVLGRNYKELMVHRTYCEPGFVPHALHARLLIILTVTLGGSFSNTRLKFREVM